jgi:hypothetical protein
VLMAARNTGAVPNPWPLEAVFDALILMYYPSYGL